MAIIINLVRKPVHFLVIPIKFSGGGGLLMIGPGIAYVSQHSLSYNNWIIESELLFSCIIKARQYFLSNRFKSTLKLGTCIEHYHWE